MVIGFRRRFLFIHVPKCAGESIAAILRNEANGGVQLDRKHATWSDAKAILGEDLASFTTMAAVRNPFDQVVSFYEHLRKPLWLDAAAIERQFPGTGGRIMPVWASELAIELEFPAWVRRVYSSAAPETDRRIFADLGRWLSGGDGRIAVQRILRYERLAEDWADTARELGLQGDLPHENASRRDRGPYAYRARYDTATRAIVENHFAATLAAFSYAF
jgi:hypothetical protein